MDPQIVDLVSPLVSKAALPEDWSLIMELLAEYRSKVDSGEVTGYPGDQGTELDYVDNLIASLDRQH